MSTHRVRALALRIIRQFRHDRRALALIFLVPLLVLALLGYLLRSDEGIPRIAVVDLDPAPQSAVAAAMAVLRQDRLFQVSTYPTEAAARERLRQGKLAAYVVFPQGFTAATRLGRQLPVRIVLQGADPSQSADVMQRLQRVAVRLAPRPSELQLRTEYLFGGRDLDRLDYFAPVLVGFFAFFFIFMLTSVSFLRERVQGTLERLMASPLRRGEIVLGYMLGFSFFALLQAVLILLFSVVALRVHYRGNLLLAFLIEALMVVGAVNLGIFLSAFARNEFQAVQFIPLVIVPQALLSGLIFPVDSMPAPLQVAAHFLPLTYATFGLRDVMIKGFGLLDGGVLLDLAVLLAFAALAVVAGTFTLRRRLA
jgi:ABC-2 type transport system permease protein